MTNSSQPLNNTGQLKLAKRASQWMVIALIVLYTCTSLMSDKILWTVLLAPCLSLAIFLPGMIQNHARSYDWLCFVILIHFTVGVTNMMSPSAEWNDYVQTLLTSALFISAMMASRWQKASLRVDQERQS
ncbi:MAG: DUF2069 domain-containing protein [Cellvibrionaceae bacterium]